MRVYSVYEVLKGIVQYICYNDTLLTHSHDIRQLGRTPPTPTHTYYADRTSSLSTLQVHQEWERGAKLCDGANDNDTSLTPHRQPALPSLHPSPQTHTVFPSLSQYRVVAFHKRVGYFFFKSCAVWCTKSGTVILSCEDKSYLGKTLSGHIKLCLIIVDHVWLGISGHVNFCFDYAKICIPVFRFGSI